MTNPPEPALTFEVALRQLEQIVEALERGEPELSSALARYEQGVHLLAHCQAVLERAERSVALLTGVDAAGNPVTAPFDAAATDTAVTDTAVDPVVRPKAKPSPRKRPASPLPADDDDLAPF